MLELKITISGPEAEVLRFAAGIVEGSEKHKVTYQIELTGTGHSQSLMLFDDTPIEDLDFTVRVYNNLKREGVHTIRDLAHRSEAELMDIRNFAASALQEVKDKLAERGFSLKPN